MLLSCGLQPKTKKKKNADKNMHVLKKSLSMLQGVFIKHFAFVI